LNVVNGRRPNGQQLSRGVIGRVGFKIDEVTAYGAGHAGKVHGHVHSVGFLRKSMAETSESWIMV